MHGRYVDEGSWGGLPLLVDTSAWARSAHPDVRDRWLSVLLEDRIRISPPTRIEIFQSARSGEEFDRMAEHLDTLHAAPLTPSIAHAAEAGMRALAHRSAGSQRLPVVDYLVAATAQEMGAAVLHYDRDYDTLAEVMEFESIWLAPAGALP
jgi:predicted nucleic acid-binding protein